MINNKLIDKLGNCKTMKQLDELRLPIVQASRNGDFLAYQEAFIKAKNKITRIPLRDRPEVTDEQAD